MKKRLGLWIILFVSLALLLGALATGWNFVLISEYLQKVELARSATPSLSAPVIAKRPIPSMIWGTLGFIIAMMGALLFFVRLVREMRLNQAQSEFLANVSHELKSPIAALELTSSLLRSGELSQGEIQKLWDSHQSELTRLREDVDLLLETARLESQPSLPRRAYLDLDDWIDSSQNRWRSLLGPGATLKIEGEKLHAAPLLDARMLNLIADNLIGNARKFSRSSAQVTVRTERDPEKGGKHEKWRIRFEDRGMGFDPSHSVKIFSRFFRSKTEAAYSIPGTGLGLHLAISASRALGISLTGESPGIGRGASFTLEGKIPSP